MLTECVICCCPRVRASACCRGDWSRLSPLTRPFAAVNDVYWSAPSIKGGRASIRACYLLGLSGCAHFLRASRLRRHAVAGVGTRHRAWHGLPQWQTTSRYLYHRSTAAERRSERVATWPPRLPLRARRARTPHATRALGGHRGPTRVYLYSTVRWIHIMKPVRLHSVDPGECNRPPGQPARTRRRPPGYTQARNRECPEVTDLAVVSGQIGAKLAI